MALVFNVLLNPVTATRGRLLAGRLRTRLADNPGRRSLNTAAVVPTSALVGGLRGRSTASPAARFPTERVGVRPAALHLREQEMSLRDMAKRLVITAGKKKGRHPSPATVMRCCASTTNRLPWSRPRRRPVIGSRSSRCPFGAHLGQTRISRGVRAASSASTPAVVRDLARGDAGQRGVA